MSELPQVPLNVPQKAQLLYGSPTRPGALDGQSLSLGSGGNTPPSDQALSLGTVEKAKDTFSPVQSTEQTVKADTKGADTQQASSNTPSSQKVDVVKDYDWTLSRNKQALADTIPYINLREFDIVGSNAATSLYATIGAVGDVLQSNVDAVKSAISPAPGGMIDKALQSGQDAAQNLSKVVKNLQSNEKYGIEWSDDLKKTYGNLYLRKPTGGEYVLPYFTKDMLRVSGMFADTANSVESSVVSNAATMVSDAAHKLLVAGTSMPSLIEPGVYIQRPKYFQFNNPVATISVSFTLFNTVTPDSYLQNSTLIKRLLLKNLPQRMNKVVVYPPAIYEVTIPGRAFYPYCYIDTFTVTHEGTKRIINVEGREEIVPDAYNITMAITSLTNDTNNFYVEQMGNAGVNMDTREVVGTGALAAVSNALGVTSKPKPLPLTTKSEIISHSDRTNPGYWPGML